MANVNPVTTEELSQFFDMATVEQAARDARRFAERIEKTIDRPPTITAHQLRMARSYARCFQELYDALVTLASHDMDKREIEAKFKERT